MRRVAPGPPRSQSKPVDPTAADDAVPGSVTVGDRVVVKVVSRAAAEHPDVGAVAPRLLGTSMPGLDRVGGRTTSLTQLPRTTADVDGQEVYVTCELSIRYPAPLVTTTEAVRALVRTRIAELTGLEVKAVDITVGALLDLPVARRVR